MRHPLDVTPNHIDMLCGFNEYFQRLQQLEKPVILQKNTNDAIALVGRLKTLREMLQLESRQGRQLSADSILRHGLKNSPSNNKISLEELKKKFRQVFSDEASADYLYAEGFVYTLNPTPRIYLTTGQFITV